MYSAIKLKNSANKDLRCFYVLFALETAEQLRSNDNDNG